MPNPAPNSDLKFVCPVQMTVPQAELGQSAGAAGSETSPELARTAVGDICCGAE